MPIYQPSIFRTECDACGVPFPVNTGGVCERCRRILCATHLHGSLLRRVRIALGASMTCVDCRRGVTPPPTPAPRTP